MGQPSDGEVDRWRRRSRWFVDLCLDRAEQSLAVGKGELGARWLHRAARIADACGSGCFVEPRLERGALALARGLPATASQPRGDGPRRWLHVVSEARSIGGHTAFLRRWIDHDRSGDKHAVAVTGSVEIPRALLESVRGQGGSIVPLAGTTVLGRAKALRAAAHGADVVVLHHHMWDIVPAIALGVPGGPPVLTINHADHTFWVGAAVTDLAINLRPVSAELNARYRSIDRNGALPIPLDPPPDGAARAISGATIRRSLGIPPEAIVFLTIGSGFKYAPIGELDFPAAAARLLDRLPGAYLIAVGPLASRPEWRNHVRALHPRLIALGPLQGVGPYHAAADIYLEGFPFDSATALLEASLADLPVVPVPAVAPLPFSAHGGLKAAVPQSASVDDYVEDAVRLAQSLNLRRERAERLTQAVVGACIGDAWDDSLARLVGRLPTEHRVYPVDDVPLDETLDRFLTRLLMGRGPLLMPRLAARLAGEALIGA